MVYYDRIKTWLEHNNFPTRKDAENYIKIHGGWSSGVEDTLDFVYGNEQNLPDFIQLEPATPLEELQGIRQPTSLEEERIDRQVEEETEVEKQLLGEPVEPEPVEPEVVQQNIIRRLRRFLGSIFSG